MDNKEKDIKTDSSLRTDETKEKTSQVETAQEVETTSKIKMLFTLFITLFKIGLFTFGGGYAMIPLFENEFITKRKWTDSKEFTTILVLSESTPGPIAVNFATYIGYKKAKVWGSIFATLGVILPSFIIIFILSLFFDNLLDIKVVASAFKGIQVAVIFLIFSAGLKMLIKGEKSVLNFIILGITIICSITLSIFAVSMSSIVYVLVFAFVGLMVYLISNARKKSKEVKKWYTFVFSGNF